MGRQMELESQWTYIVVLYTVFHNAESQSNLMTNILAGEQVKNTIRSCFYDDEEHRGVNYKRGSFVSSIITVCYG
jgi:hypothetical protein